MDIEECQRECDTILKAYMAELQRQYDGSRPASTEFLNRYKIILDSAELSAERALQFAKMNCKIRHGPLIVLANVTGDSCTS